MLKENPLPIVYLSRTSYTSDTPDIDSLPVTDIVIRKDTLENFLSIENSSLKELPLDYGVIFTGVEYTFSEIESMRERAKKENNRLDAFLENTLGPLLTKAGDQIHFSHILNFHKNQASSHYIENTNLRILE